MVFVGVISRSYLNLRERVGPGRGSKSAMRASFVQKIFGAGLEFEALGAETALHSRLPGLLSSAGTDFMRGFLPAAGGEPTNVRADG